MDRQSNPRELSRRTFLPTTSAALVGAAWGGLVPQTEAARRHPQRGGVLQFGTRTDAGGLDEIIGKPKREDSVRLTALRTGQVNLIDALAFADVERFQKSHDDTYNLWTTHFGGIFMVFNFTNGPFQDQRLRTAAAHAIDRTYPPPSGQGIGRARHQTTVPDAALLPLGTYQKGGLQWLDNTQVTRVSCRDANS